MRGLLLVLLIVVIAMVGGAAYYFLLSPEPDSEVDSASSTFTIIQMERAGNFGYAVFNHRGDANLTLIGLNEKPERKLTILNDTDGMEMEQLAEFIGLIKGLEDYGFTVEVTERKMLGNGIYIVPTGAIPNYVYDDLWYNATNATVLFIGQDDLVIRRGIKKENWYSSLSEVQKERVVLYDMTLDELMESGNVSIINDVLENSWNKESRSSRVFSGHGIKTLTTFMDDSDYLRVIYQYPGGIGIVDSAILNSEGSSLIPDPPAIYPWEKSTLSFELNKTNGTAFLSVYHNGEGLLKEELRRVTDDNYFLKRLQFDEPGEYIVKVEDNEGTISSGVLHLNDLQIDLVEGGGINYIFYVTVDSQPLKSAEVTVSREGSDMEKQFFIHDGELHIQTKLDEGPNTLNMKLFGATIPVEVQGAGSSILQFYLTYGLPGLFVVLAVFFIARMTRRPIYRIRFSDLGSEIRKEIHFSSADAMNAFKEIREEMRLGKTPITADEFGIAIKRFVTNGAEVTSGNVEELLNKMCQRGKLESHRGYYQPASEKNVKKNALLRIAREKLIEEGISFNSQKDKLITKDYEIGFFGSKFKKKALIIVDDSKEEKSIISSLSEREQSILKIKQSNDLIVFVPISNLGDYL